MSKEIAALADRWDEIADTHGVRTFTGNDHRLFANELRAAISQQPSAVMDGQRFIDWNRSLPTPHIRIGYELSVLEHLRRYSQAEAPQRAAGVPEGLVGLPAKWRAEADFIVANSQTCNVNSIRARADELEAALYAAAPKPEGGS